MCSVALTVVVFALALLSAASTQEDQEDVSFVSVGPDHRSEEETARLAALGAELEEELRLAERNGEGAIPGEPQQDYPVYTRVPRTSFTCGDKHFPGYYVDVEARCQAFHICEAGGAKHSFLCPSGSIFSQKFQVCDWWYSSECPDTQPDSARLYHQREEDSRFNQQEDFSLNEASNQDLVQNNNYVFFPSDIFHGAETGVPNRDRIENYNRNNNTNAKQTEEENLDKTIGLNNQQEYKNNNSHITSDKLKKERTFKRKQHNHIHFQDNGLPFVYKDIASTSTSTMKSDLSDENRKLK